jgi:hypothetical protein
MVLDGLGHEPVDRAARRGDDLQYIGAGNLGLKRAGDGADLPENAPDASQELRFFPDRMRHDCLPFSGCGHSMRFRLRHRQKFRIRLRHPGNQLIRLRQESLKQSRRVRPVVAENQFDSRRIALQAANDD